MGIAPQNELAENGLVCHIAATRLPEGGL